jgi:hypothetical protein
MSHSDLSEQVSLLEGQIERLKGVIERCRKIVLVSKIAMAAGATLMVAIFIGAVRFDATALLLSITAVIGGFVLFGSNNSTSEQTEAALQAAEARRTELIDRAGLKVVDDAPPGLPHPT